MSSTDIENDQTAEIERLRARVTQLEAQLVEVEDWANRTVGAAQERLYWLDRWHIDLNRMMERPGASEFRAAMRAVREVRRFVLRLKRRLLGQA
jgi:hypothetical protein